MTKKRGQISMIIIIAVIIFVAIAVLFFIRTINKKNQDLDVNSIEGYINSCVETVSKEGIYLISLQGGYFEVPNPKEEYSYIEIPIYWDTKKDYFPEKEKVEREIIRYIKFALPICLNEFNSYKEKGFNFETKGIKSSANIKRDSVKIKINYPILIRKGDSTYLLEDFSSEIDTNINKGYEISRLITEEHKKSKNSFLLGYITNLAYENNIKFETMNFNDNEVLISLILDDNEIPFIYSFIIKYGGEV